VSTEFQIFVSSTVDDLKGVRKSSRKLWSSRVESFDAARIRTFRLNRG
jgi:hypothetical protein